VLGYDRKTNVLDFMVAPRGYRALAKIPRLPRLVAQKIVQRFDDLEGIVATTDEELAAVDGVGDARAQEIRAGLRRLQEVGFADR